jgi:hypothetical protein
MLLVVLAGSVALLIAMQRWPDTVSSLSTPVAPVTSQISA